MNRRTFYLKAQELAQQGETWLGIALQSDLPEFAGAAALWQEGRLQSCFPIASKAVWQSMQTPPVWQACIGSRVEGKIYFEPYLPSPRLILCGGGHVSLPIYRMATMLGFAVTVIEDREELAEQARFPQAELVCKPFAESLRGLHGENCYYVLVTRGPEYDCACLEQILTGSFAYIGMLGSAIRREKVWAELLAKGYAEAQLAAIHTPIGLQIGAETPEEIAVAVLAEIIQIWKQKEAGQVINATMMARLTDTPTQKQALVSIVARSGVSPRNPGTRMLVEEDGNCYGTIGGGYLEQIGRELARQVMATGQDICREEDMKAAGTAGKVTLLVELL